MGGFQKDAPLLVERDYDTTQKNPFKLAQQLRFLNSTHCHHFTTTMFDIPELDDMVYQRLGRSDLSQCALVNKKWHRIAVPYLWYDVTFLGHPYFIGKKKEAFIKLIMDDFLHERWHEYTSKQGMDQRRLSSPFSPSLAKRGRWIRKIPKPKEMMLNLGPSLYNCYLLLPPTERREPLTPDELLHHFYKRCHTIQFESIILQPEDVENHHWRAMTEDVAVHVRHVSIQQTSNHTKMESWRLKYLLDRLSATLQTLTLQSGIKYEEKDVEQGMKDWRVFKELKLKKCCYATTLDPFWTWLWARCGHLEKLELSWISIPTTQYLVNAMLTHMPNIHTIQLIYHQSQQFQDKQIAELLSGSYNGWRVVNASGVPNFESAAVRALTKHFHTLQELIVDGCRGFEGEELVRVLSSCPNLHTLVAIDDRYHQQDYTAIISAEHFIDREFMSGSLKAWPCEATLKVLKVKIGGIPKPNPKSPSTPSEVYVGQGREIQRFVYERLGRLTKLETLWLGHDYGHYDQLRHGHRSIQPDCLELSLESGLAKLERLKALKELNMERMKKNAKLQDVRWMADNWPKLTTIFGLDELHEDQDAVEWLKDHYPKINVPYALCWDPREDEDEDEEDEEDEEEEYNYDEDEVDGDEE